MGRILPVSALFCLISLGSLCRDAGKNEGVVFSTGTFKEILAKAKAENKLVFVMAYASWCTPCRRMQGEVFPQKKVGDYFNSTFVNARFDMERGEGPWIARRYNVQRYPTFLILDGDGVLLGTMIGGSPADDFLMRIKLLVQKGRPLPIGDEFFKRSPRRIRAGLQERPGPVVRDPERFPGEYVV